MAIFTGAGVAIVTPMYDNGKVNFDKLGELIEFQIEGGTDAIIICGTTGESSTLTHEEHLEAIKYTVDKVAKRIPVVAGTGSNCTETAIYLSQEAEKFGAERVSDTIKEVQLDGDVKVLKSEKNEYQGKNVIIATGAYSRPIGCKGEAEFMGKGVSYCATCDANFFEDFEVYVVGGGDSAVEEAMYLTKFARKVTIIHRRNELRAAKSIQEKAFANPKIDFFWDSVVEEVYGDDILLGNDRKECQDRRDEKGRG